MFENLDVFVMSSAMARHAGSRQALIAQNVANADTPQYKSQDLPSFSSVFEQPDAGGQKATRARHLNSAMNLNGIAPIERGSGRSPDGNTVSIEQEMLKATEVQREHDRALAIYKSALGILRSTLGRR